MSWKEDIAKMVEQNDMIERLLRLLQGQVAINSKRIEAVRVLLDGQIKNQSRSADRMADRMIEMAMVNQGKPTEAAVHRTRSDNAFSSQDAWAVGSEQNPDDVWPPAGCDSMELRG